MKHLKAATCALLFVVALMLPSLQLTEAEVGVCYGMLGNNLPSHQEVIKLYKSNNIGSMRIYSPKQGALQALQGSGIKLILDVAKEQLQSLGSDPYEAMQWVNQNVVNFSSSIKYISVGNEINPTDNEASSIRPAMDNILNALKSANLADQIKVSTATYMGLMKNTSPPSDGEFIDMSFMGPIIDFLTSNGSPLLLNVYPYFAYTDDHSIGLDFALFNGGDSGFIDSGTQLEYNNLFDAQVDSVYAALAKAGAPDTVIVVSESGWPSDGGDAAYVENARTYYNNLINHVKKGTPLKPQALETYLFAMFDENQKPGKLTEQHFGLFSPWQQPKYQLSFN